MKTSEQWSEGDVCTLERDALLWCFLKASISVQSGEKERTQSPKLTKSFPYITHSEKRALKFREGEHETTYSPEQLHICNNLIQMKNTLS